MNILAVESWRSEQHQVGLCKMNKFRFTIVTTFFSHIRELKIVIFGGYTNIMQLIRIKKKHQNKNRDTLKTSQAITVYAKSDKNDFSYII